MDDSDSEVQELIKKTSLIHNKSKTDDSSESEDDAENEPKRERKNYQYSFVKEYDNYEIATQEIETMYLLALQSSQSTTIFKKGRQLYLKKWSPNKQVTNCLKDFFSYWGKEDTENWYEGYHVLKTFPSHNNGLESNNLVVKDDGTLPKRLLCGLFIELMKNKIVKNS